MDQEIKSIEKNNNTWELTSLLSWAKKIGVNGSTKLSWMKKGN